MPSTTAAARATGIDAIPAITAAASVRSRMPGPSSPVLATLAPASGALRIVTTAARAPASAHTIVETRFTLIPASRAASGLSAAARTAMP